ncbi:MAG: hypothetical protein HQM11_01745 [SAR324 cluster bacterium]|nr:hypothetical protein [SAR324 cluster bacterium]
MPETDQLKEQIGYAKFWMGILAASGMADITWIVNHLDHVNDFKFILAVIFLFGVLVSIILLHSKIEQKIDELRRL